MIGSDDGMKLKYYLRGLGIGIVLSTLVLSLANQKSSKVELTDEEIIQRAEALGMKKSNVNIDYDAINESINGANSENNENNNEKDSNVNKEESKKDTNQNEKVEEQKPETVTKAPEKDNEVSDPISPIPTESEDQGNSEATDSSKVEEPTATPIVEPTKKPQKEEEKQVVAVTITSGMTAYQVSKLLEQAGVVDDARDFDDYLIENDMEDQILSQKVEVEVGADYETIAHIITHFR